MYTIVTLAGALLIAVRTMANLPWNGTTSRAWEFAWRRSLVKPLESGSWSGRTPAGTGMETQVQWLKQDDK